LLAAIRLDQRRREIDSEGLLGEEQKSVELTCCDGGGGDGIDKGSLVLGGVERVVVGGGGGARL
jgi:hypothetical protein